MVVPDTNLSEFKPKAASVTSSFLASVLSSEVLGLKPYSTGIMAAKAASKGRESKEVIALALTNVGAQLASEVEGRVLTEVDPSLANNETGMISEVEHLSSLYIRANVPANKVIFRLPATWEGIAAGRALGKKGIATQLHLVSSLQQAAACAQANVSVVGVSLGRVREFYKKNPGVVSGFGPRQDAGSLVSSESDPGLDLVRSIYSYFLQHHHNHSPKLFVSGIRSKEDAMAVSGADFILLPLAVLQSLANEVTTAGYNDGLHIDEGQFKPSLRPETMVEVPLMPQLTAATFDDALPMVASSILNSSLKQGVEERGKLIRLLGIHTTTSSQL